MLPSSVFNEIAHQPSDLLTYVGNISPEPCASTQTHHLIPKEVWNDQDGFLNDPHVRLVLNMTGGPEDPMNLMELPSTAAGAEASNLALHNGSHPVVYNQAVYKKLEVIETAYKAALSAHGGVPSVETDLLLTTSIHALQLDLRQRLDRSSGSLPQLTLSNSDPNAFMSTPEYRAEMVTLGSVVDGVQANARQGYPSQSSADKACESAQALTAAQLRTTAAELRAKAWAGMPDGSGPEDTAAGVLAKEKIDQQLPQMRERTLAEIMDQTAREHPFDAAMFKVGASMVAGVGAFAVASVASAGSALTGAAASVGAIVLTNAPAKAGSIPSGLNVIDVLPATHAEMAKGTDEMGERGEVNRIVLERAGGPAQGHLILLRDGKVQMGSIPFGNNPSIAAGKNSGSLGLLYEGEGKMTPQQEQTVQKITDWLRTQRQREGLSSNIEIIAGSTATAEILHLPTPRGPLASQGQVPVGILAAQHQQRHMSASAP